MPDDTTFRDRRTALSEAFHAFNQPLTGLHCGLELSLLKERSESEYRERLQDALRNAGAIVKLSRALRELVDASDPGEHFGINALEPLLFALKAQIAPLAESKQVSVTIAECCNSRIKADPTKLLCALGGILTYLISGLDGDGSIAINVSETNRAVVLTLKTLGLNIARIQDIEAQALEIRRDAGFGYIQTIGGTVKPLASGLHLVFPKQRRLQTSLPATRSRTIGSSASRKS